MRVLPRENEAVNECSISDKDRFSYEGLNSFERLQKPMVRFDGVLREVEWNVALDYVSHTLKDIVTTYSGGIHCCTRFTALLGGRTLFMTKANSCVRVWKYGFPDTTL